MTEAELVERVAKTIGILTDDDDVLEQVKMRMYGTIGYINGGGGHLNISELSDYEILCISLGVADLLVQKLPDYSPGFAAMASQLMLKDVTDNG